MHLIYMEVKQVLCECGIIVKGLSKEVLRMNLLTHKKGRKHKEQMQALKELKEKKQ